MGTPDPRTVLEGIAFGDDPQVTPGDRVRALGELRALGVPDPHSREFYDVLAALSTDELDQALDAFVGPEDDAELDRIMDGTSTRWPRLSVRVRAELDRRVAELADADRIEAEVDRRARELAETYYRQRRFQVVDGPQSSQDEPRGRTPVVHPPERRSAPSGLSPEVAGRQAATFRPLAEPGPIRVPRDEFRRKLNDR